MSLVNRFWIHGAHLLNVRSSSLAACSKFRASAFVALHFLRRMVLPYCKTTRICCSLLPSYSQLVLSRPSTISLRNLSCSNFLCWKLQISSDFSLHLSSLKDPYTGCDTEFMEIRAKQQCGSATANLWFRSYSAISSTAFRSWYCLISDHWGGSCLWMQLIGSQTTFNHCLS